MCVALIFCNIAFYVFERYNTAGHQQRWAEVEKAIEKKGTYELTTSELTFGAKTAWRNAARCIGRIQWSKLQVIPHVKLIYTISSSSHCPEKG